MTDCSIVVVFKGYTSPSSFLDCFFLWLRLGGHLGFFFRFLPDKVKSSSKKEKISKHGWIEEGSSSRLGCNSIHQDDSICARALRPLHLALFSLMRYDFLQHLFTIWQKESRGDRGRGSERWKCWRNPLDDRYERRFYVLPRFYASISSDGGGSGGSHNIFFCLFVGFNLLMSDFIE